MVYEAGDASLEQGRAVSRTVGLEHECPFTSNPYRLSFAAHFLDTYGTKCVPRPPLNKSVRRAQLTVYRSQDRFRRKDWILLPEFERLNVIFRNPQELRQCRASRR